MPLVISHKARKTFFVRSEGVLGEILGHGNFDGEGWAIGDSILFEDGQIAEIEQVEGQKFHVWTSPRAATLPETVARIKEYGDARLPHNQEVDTWEKLFEAFAVQTPCKESWWHRMTRERPMFCLALSFVVGVFGYLLAAVVFHLSIDVEAHINTEFFEYALLLFAVMLGIVWTAVFVVVAYDKFLGRKVPRFFGAGGYHPVTPLPLPWWRHLIRFPLYCVGIIALPLCMLFILPPMYVVELAGRWRARFSGRDPNRCEHEDV